MADFLFGNLPGGRRERRFRKPENAVIDEFTDGERRVHNRSTRRWPPMRYSAKPRIAAAGSSLLPCQWQFPAGGWRHHGLWQGHCFSSGDRRFPGTYCKETSLHPVAFHWCHWYLWGEFPCAIGCIDGTHIGIQAQNDHENGYVNRRGYHSINVQGICNHEGQLQIAHIRHAHNHLLPCAYHRLPPPLSQFSWICPWCVINVSNCYNIKNWINII